MLLNNQNFSGGVHEDYRRYVNLGNKFYKILIEPCLAYTDRKNFTIVPDGAITYIPFEGLITKPADLEYINYMDLYESGESPREAASEALEYAGYDFF